MTVAVEYGGLTSVSVHNWSFRYHGNDSLRKGDCLLISRYFRELAEMSAPDKMHPADIGQPMPGVMCVADLEIIR